MKRSLTLFNIRGVPLRLHWTFLLVVALIAWAVLRVTGSLWSVGYAVGMIAMVFGFVLVHELAHVGVARRYGVPTREITLLPIGGVSHMERIPTEPRQEAAISAAGPLVNVVAAIALAWPVFHLHGGWDAFTRIHLLDPTQPSFLLDMFWLNVIMGAFNLLPAFPLDGGRVLRALIAIRAPYARATKIAADVGRFFGVAFALAGIFWFGNIFLAIIGVFVFLGAGAEERAATAAAVFKDGAVRDAMRRDVTAVSPDEPLHVAVERSFRSHQLDFPVVEDGHLIGILDRTGLGSGRGHPDWRVRDVMLTRVRPLRPDDDLATAFQAFQAGKTKALPVVSTQIDLDRAPMAPGTRPPDATDDLYGRHGDVPELHEAQVTAATIGETTPRDARAVATGADVGSGRADVGASDANVDSGAAAGERTAFRSSADDASDLAFPRTRGLRFVGLLTVEDMERAYMFLTQQGGHDQHTRIASPMGAGTMKRRYPRAVGTRRRQDAPTVRSDDVEAWVPVVGEDARA